LICENYEPFLMTDVLTGNPSETGTWLNSNGVALDGFYDPETMNGGLFTYMVDEVPYCDPAFSSLFIIENVIGNPGQDANVQICSNAPSVDLFNLLEGNPETGGYWLNQLGQPVNASFSPAPGLDGTYTYVLPGETPCPAQSATVGISFTPFHPAGSDNSLEICENHEALNLFESLNGNPISGGMWFSSDGVQVSPIVDPATSQGGVFTHLYQDGGCPADTAFIELLIDAMPNAGDDNSHTLCGSIAANLNEFLSVDITAGAWYSSGTIVSDPSAVYTGTGLTSFLYIAESVYDVCPSDTSAHIIFGEQAPELLTDMELSICVGEGIVDLNDLTGVQVDATWSNQGTPVSSDLDISEPSEWVLTVVQDSGNSCPDESADVIVHVQGEYFDEQSLIAEICDQGATVDLYALTGNDLSAGTWYDQNGAIITDGVLNSNPEGNYLLVSSADYTCGADTLFIVIDTFYPLSAGPDSEQTLCEDSEPFAWEYLVAAESFNVYFDNLDMGPEFDPQIMQPGNYEVVTLSQGPCPADTAVITIDVLPAMAFDAGPDIVMCEGEAPVQIGQPAEGGCTYQWIPSLNLNNNLVSNPEFSPTEVASSPWTQEYVVIVSNGYCNTSDSISVTINPGAQAELMVPETVCTGTDITADVQGNLSEWIWILNGNTVQQNGDLNIAPESTMSIEISGSNEWGCEGQASAMVEVITYPQALISNLPDPSCSPVQLDLHADLIGDDNAVINWFINGEWAGTGEWLESQWFGQGEQDLLVTLESESGCTTEISLEDAVVVYPSPIAQIEASSLVADMFHPSVTLSDISENADERLWTLPDGNNIQDQLFIHEFNLDSEENHSFLLEVWNSFGCSDTAMVIIRTENDHIFYAPNSFTPDNDGINEEFRPVFTGYDNESYSLSIYDRWGLRIFQTSDPEEGWKGDNMGGEYYVQQDVYVWKVSLRVAGKAEYDTFSGFVTVIR
ncbi:MAG: hypothetical protein RL220_2051, partial [Bacteroidota bacterium]